ncbi:MULTISPECIES: diguanylate phosphodiesterase [unclassified Variovorax]|uniref:diguanylate phosphodiesterase n=1 Tax=unclassified Variovorax TaxID=663243 RepID=UPI003F46EA1F
MQPLIHIAYASKATQAFEPRALAQLMQRASDANESRGLTGFLLYDDRHFFQLLEGPPAVVEETLQKIVADARHGEIVCILKEPLPARQFDEWSMSSMTLTRAELGAIDGLQDFFDAGATFMQMNPAQARRVIAAFADGRWRQNIAGRAAQGSIAAADPDVSAPAAAAWRSAYGRSYAYQPIIDTATRRVVSYEALVRGARGESAFQVLGAVPAAQLYGFDADGRVDAIEQAARLGIDCDLNLNFMPQSAIASPRGLDSTLEAAMRCGIAPERIVIEITETEAIQDHRSFSESIDVYRRQGLKVAIDDFGAGYSGLNLLAEFQPDQLKVDIALVRQIQMSGPRQSIVRAIVGLCRELRIDLIAEGIESTDQLRWLEDQGVHLFQGYLFAKPGFECLPMPAFP